MEDYSKQHKKAWEFDAYNFWVKTSGTPEERASEDKADPKKMLKQYKEWIVKKGKAPKTVKVKK